MKCGQAEKWMDAALDERSGGAEFLPAGWSAQRRAELETHLAACPTCRAQWQVLCSAEAVLRVPKPVPAPESLLADFRQRLAAEERHEVQRAPRRNVGWRWLWPMGSLAAAGVAAAAVFMFNIQAPVTTVQDMRNARGLGSPAASSQVSGAPAPQAGKRDALAAKPSPNWYRTPAAPGAIAAPKPERMAAAPSLNDTLRSVTPPASDALSLAQRPTEPAKDFARLEERASDRDGAVRPLARNKETLHFDVRTAEPEGGTQFAPYRQDAATAGKQTLAKEHAEFGEKSANAGRPRGEANGGAQKPSQSVAVAGVTGLSASQVQQQNFGLVYSNTAQAAPSDDLYYAQVPAEPTPVELNVSAAVLNALQRPVELRNANMRVQDLALQLSAEADVEVRVDPQVARLSVTLGDADVPLWRVLEDVARQTQMEIFPRDNSLVLRLSRNQVDANAAVLADKAEAKRSQPTRAKKLPEAMFRSVRPDPKPTAEAPAPPPAAGPVAGSRGAFGGGASRGGSGGSLRPTPAPVATPAPDNKRYAYSSRRPDRKFWPAAWGNLPERGFEVPTAEELPPLTLAPVQLGQALSNEVPQVRARHLEVQKAQVKKARSKR